MSQITLPDDIATKLGFIAAQNGETLEAAAYRALRSYVAYIQQEELRWKEALVADNAIERGEGIEAQKMIPWLESWGTESELPPP